MSMSEHSQNMDALSSLCRVAAGVVLAELHDEVNALGGAAITDEDRVINEFVGKALALIEAKQEAIRHGA